MDSEALTSKDGLYNYSMMDWDADQRRVDPSERKTYEIKNLWQRSHEIVNLAVRGFKQTEIAEILGIHPQTVSNTLNSKLGQLKLSSLRRGRDEDAKKITEKIRVLTDKALNVYHEVFDNDSGEVTLKDKRDAAKDFLNDLSGLRSPIKVQSHNIHTQLSKEELEEFKQRGLRAAKESGIIIDAETVAE